MSKADLDDAVLLESRNWANWVADAEKERDGKILAIGAKAACDGNYLSGGRLKQDSRAVTEALEQVVGKAVDLRRKLATKNPRLGAPAYLDPLKAKISDFVKNGVTWVVERATKTMPGADAGIMNAIAHYAGDDAQIILNRAMNDLDNIALEITLLPETNGEIENNEQRLRREFEQLSRIKFELEEQDVMIMEMLDRGKHAVVPGPQIDLLKELFDEIIPLCEGYRNPGVNTNNPDGVRPLIRSARAKVEWRLRALQPQSLPTTDSANSASRNAKSNSVDPRKVFVVHGRNMEARDAMFRFLRALDLAPIEWEEAVAMTGKASPYVGEVLDAGLSQAHAVVVLITGDDLAILGTRHRKPNDPAFEHTLTPQARPNVLLEAGMALGKYPDRTVIVEIGSTRAFSDIMGRNTIRLPGDQHSRHALAGRLRTTGCRVQTDHNSAWLSEGDFEAANYAPDTTLP